MSLTQLDPPLVLNTPKGKAIAHFVIDYSIESDLYWVCFQHDTGECWTWNNKDIRIDNNSTIGRDVKRNKSAVPLNPLTAVSTNGIANGH